MHVPLADVLVYSIVGNKPSNPGDASSLGVVECRRVVHVW